MITNDSYVIRKEACPKCRELGHDRSGDNLAVYSDGHTYCYRCGHGTGRKSFTEAKPRVTSELVLPADVTAELPFEARAWLGQYQLARRDLIPHNLLWSDSWSRLIFPYFNDTGLIAWQGRYIQCGDVQHEDKTPAKWFSQGAIHEIVHPIKVTNRSAILVEDIVSAIKVSRFAGTIPIFGSTVSTKQLLRLRQLVDSVTFWLDPDMRAKSVKMAHNARLFGLNASVIFSEHDPKEESYATIENAIRENQAAS